MSVLLSVATVVLWARSKYLYEGVNWTGLTYGARVEHSRGKVLTQGFWVPDGGRAAETPEGFAFWSRPIDPYLGNLDEGYDTLMGIAYQGDTFGYGPPYHSRLVVIPFWMLFATFALLAILTTRTLFKRRWTGANICSSCGYDLRATPDRCPECGTVPTKKRISN
jgi:hypothetical protein